MLDYEEENSSNEAISTEVEVEDVSEGEQEEKVISVTDSAKAEENFGG